MIHCINEEVAAIRSRVTEQVKHCRERVRPPQLCPLLIKPQIQCVEIKVMCRITAYCVCVSVCVMNMTFKC